MFTRLRLKGIDPLAFFVGKDSNQNYTDGIV